MSIRGVETFERRGTHLVLTGSGQVVALQIAAIPLQVGMEIERALPAPQPPVKVLGFSAKENKPRTEVDERDPAYLAARAEWLLRRAAAIAYHGLRHEPAIEWDTRPTSQPDAAFYGAIRDELANLGMSAEEIVRIAAAVRELALVSEETLKEASRDFLPRAEVSPTSG